MVTFGDQEGCSSCPCGDYVGLGNVEIKGLHSYTAARWSTVRQQQLLVQGHSQ
jgi:hypothetical protein